MRTDIKPLRALLIFTLCASLFGLASSCDCVSTEDGKVTFEATIPLLPIDLPIFPTDVTLDGLSDWVMDELDDLGLGFLFDNHDIQDFFDQVEERLREASIEILQPGVLSAAIDNQITEAIRDYIEVTRVGVNFEFSNDTDSYVSVPVEFKLYLGDGEQAEAWDESVVIPFPDERVQDGQFIVPPGETISLSIDNVPHLVQALNEAPSIGIGYKALYRMADFSNGADLAEIIEKFGLCLVQGLISHDTSNCPSVEEMIGWHLTLKKFEVEIEAQSQFDIPDLPSCDEFADDYGLDYLKDACP